MFELFDAIIQDGPLRLQVPVIRFKGNPRFIRLSDSRYCVPLNRPQPMCAQRRRLHTREAEAIARRWGTPQREQA